MSERMTAIRLPGTPNIIGAFAEWGTVDAAEMIAAHRKRAQLYKEWAEAVLAADDADFLIETYSGVHVKRDRKIIQPGRLTQGETP